MGHRKTTRPLYQAIIEEDVANRRRQDLRGTREGLAGRRHVAHQLHRSPRIGHPPIDGGRQRPGIRTRGRPGSPARVSKSSSFFCAKISKNPDNSLNGVFPTVVCGARRSYNESDEGVTSTTARGR